MQLKIDTSLTYAFALEGGGARGAYQAGAWKALEESGVRYNAVAGTSVGALNGALMAMRTPDIAENLWNGIRFSRVMDVDDKTMKNLFSGRFFDIDLKDINQSLKRVIADGGFDVTPLRNLINDTVDAEKIRSGDVELYINTYSISDHKELDLDAKKLTDGELKDMLLASAYFPAFKHEKLGGKLYTDGGVQNVLPLSSLISRGYKNIIAIRIYGVGIEKKIKIPKNTTVTTIAPTRDLGSVLNFDTASCRQNFRLGYFDAQRLLYGLCGSRYYIDRTWSEQEAYAVLSEIMLSFYGKKEKDISLRRLNEEYLPKMGREIGAKGDYYDLLIAYMEAAAQKLGIDEMCICTDRGLFEKIKAAAKNSKAKFGIMKYISDGD